MGKRVLIAEFRGILRAGLRAIFLDTPDVIQVDEVLTSEDLQERLVSSPPDLIVIHQSLITDMAMLPRGHFIILADQLDKNMLLAAHVFGAVGYLFEHTSVELLRMTLCLTEGDFLLDPVFTPEILNYVCVDLLPSVATEALTEREQEVFNLLHNGLTNRSIATRLGISVTTVKTHVSHIFRKLDVKRRPVKVPLPNSNSTKGG